MTGYQVYQFVLSFFVFVILTTLFTFFVVWVVKLNLRLIKTGTEDEKIKTEYQKQQSKKVSIFTKIIDKLVFCLCCAILFVVFAFSLVVSANNGKVVQDIPVLNVVQSDSMSKIVPENKYSFGKDYNDQMQLFDLIVTYALPDEMDLKVGDVVVYQQGDILIIHRIVDIEEPNKNHPEKRWFLLQGDANKNADMFPVTYDQMKSIYKGERIPFVGSFVNFMQSPAGWLCILLVVFAMIATPVAEKKLAKAKTERLILLGIIDDGSVVTKNIDEAQNQPVEEVVDEAQSVEEDIVATQEMPAEQPKPRFGNFGVPKTFEQKLQEGGETLKERYFEISDHLCCIQKSRIVRGKKFETYRKGNSPVAKLAIRGKTLNVYLAINPQEYEGTKYKFVDVSHSKTFANYPMRVKVTSTRQVRWTKELITQMAESHGWSIIQEPVVPEMTAEERHQKLYFAHLQGMRVSKTFEQKLAEATDVAKARFDLLTNYLDGIKKVSARQSKKYLTYRRGRVPVARLAMRGKTLNLYLSLNPQDYVGTKYKFVDVSGRKSYKDFGMRIKLTSDRQVRWAKELIDNLVVQKGLVFVERGE